MEKIAFLFPGQGSQYVGMGEALYNESVTAKEILDTANTVLGFDLKALCFEGNMDELTRTANTQVAVMVASYASFKVFGEQTGIKPELMAGHSLGELTALTCAEAVSFEDMLKIVKKRGELMEAVAQDSKGSMAAISGAEIDEIQEVCREASGEGNVVVVSNLNSPEQIVISGHHEALQRAGERFKEKGVRVTPLKVGAAFHSPLMREVSEVFRKELEKTTWNDLKIPVVSNVTALPYQGKKSIVDNLVNQIVNPVNWIDTVKYMTEAGVNLAIELGPKTVLKNLTGKNTEKIKVFSTDGNKDRETLMKELFPEGEPQIMKVLTRSLAIAVCTKNSNWDNEEYDRGVVKPYRKIHKLVESLEAEKRSPSLAHMQEALGMLKSVFDTKRTPQEEQKERIEQIFSETNTRHILEEYYKNTWKIEA